MEIADRPELSKLMPNEEEREKLRQLGREVNARAGIVGKPTMTAQELLDLMRARGVRPEENGASRELMRMRYGDDWEQE